MSAAEFRVRKAIGADMPVVITLMKEFYDLFDNLNFDEEQSPRAAAELIGHPERGCLFLLSSGGAYAGYLALTFCHSLEFLGRTAWVDELYIRPEYRRRGWATNALERAEALCRQEGVRALFLEIDRDHGTIAELYRRSGFAVRADYQTMVKVLERDAEG